VNLSERMMFERKMLRMIHPNVRENSDGSFFCYYKPGFGKYECRLIKVFLGRNYPYMPPKAFVEPYEDIAGIIDPVTNESHISKNGQICFISINKWDPRWHHLAWVFSQSMWVVTQAILLRELC
jgi:hypothetical protein